MRSIWVSTLVAICAGSVTVHRAGADGPADGPGRIFEDPFLENLVGEWKIVRKLSNRTAENRMTATWVLNHQFLELHMKDVASPPAYEALVLIGIVHAEEKYVAHWCDTFGGAFSAIGYGKRAGEAIPFVFQYPDGPFYNTFAWDAGAKGWTFRMERDGKEGKRILFAEDTLTRVLPASNGRAPVRGESFLGARAGEEREVGGVRLCWCPPGHFQMGSPPDEPERNSDEAQADVTITRGFWAGKFEVTQGQWKRVAGAFPEGSAAGKGDDFPVHSVNYAEAGEFCRKLTDAARASGELPADWEFSLPTEAQWEYACRAGTTTATSFGNSLSSKQANFAGKPYNGAEAGPSLNRAARVGSYPANPWGLHDFYGNVYEWCRDWYHAKLPGGADPDLSSRQGTMNRDGTFSRVRRGGGFPDDGRPCRSASRLRFEPERRSDHIGFRVVAVRP